MKLKLALPALAALALAPVAFGQISNGAFSSGLSDWSTIGDVATRTYTNLQAATDTGVFLTNAVLAPGDDGPSSVNFSGTDVAGIIDLEDFAGLAPGALDPDAFNFVFAEEGSMLKQTISVQAGDLLSFDWAYYTNGSFEDDFAFAVIDGTVFDLSSAATLSAGSTFGFAFNTGLDTFSTGPFVNDATFDLVFGVVDANGTITSSALLVDNVSIIPEPSSLAALAGLAALGLTAMRRRARVA